MPSFYGTEVKLLTEKFNYLIKTVENKFSKVVALLGKKLPVMIVTLGCNWLACLFEKAGVLTLGLLSLLHYYMQNNVPCALV